MADPLAALERRIAADKVDFVRFEQSDTHGISRSKTIPTAHVRAFAETGLNFPLCQLSFDVQADIVTNTGYGEEAGFPDGRIRPDLSTYRVLPWADRTARLLCEPYAMDGRPVMGAPRAIARKLLAELEAIGYHSLSGFEYEFYVVHRETRAPVAPGVQLFATLRNSFDESFVHQILRGMSAVGLDVITANAEYGPGQMEINFSPATGIEAADQAFTFKTGVKEIAQRNGYIASFMTKPYADQSANGCHYHQSLLGVKTGRNAFVGPHGSWTDVWRWWLGGQIAHAGALCALAAPTVNCAKAYGGSPVAPTNASWGVENRTAGFRMKYAGGQAAHIENRLPRGSSNPYLVMAGVLAAGLDGLRNKTEPPPETDGVAHGRPGIAALPARLEQSIAALERDGAFRAALGEEFIKVYVAVKRHEIAKARAAIPDYDSPGFNTTVHDWERSEYFEFLWGSPLLIGRSLGEGLSSPVCTSHAPRVPALVRDLPSAQRHYREGPGLRDRGREARARRPLPPRPRPALPPHGPARAGASALHHRDDDVPRDGHDVLARAGRGGAGVAPLTVVGRLGRCHAAIRRHGSGGATVH